MVTVPVRTGWALTTNEDRPMPPFTRTARERHRAADRRDRYTPRPPRHSLREIPPDLRADLVRKGWPSTPTVIR